MSIRTNLTLVMKIDAEGDLQAEAVAAGMTARYRSALGFVSGERSTGQQTDFLRWKRSPSTANLGWRAGDCSWI